MEGTSTEKETPGLHVVVQSLLRNDLPANTFIAVRSVVMEGQQ
jgi:hypothetical protein